MPLVLFTLLNQICSSSSAISDRNIKDFRCLNCVIRLSLWINIGIGVSSSSGCPEQMKWYDLGAKCFWDKAICGIWSNTLLIFLSWGISLFLFGSLIGHRSKHSHQALNSTLVSQPGTIPHHFSSREKKTSMKMWKFNRILVPVKDNRTCGKVEWNR